MAFLYEVAAQYAEVLNNLQIDEETGEVLNAEALEIAAEEFDEKVESYALYVKNLRAEADAIRAEQKALDKREKGLERKINLLKNRLCAAMEATGKNKFETARVALAYSESEFVDVIDKNIVPINFMKENVTYEPDKIAMRKHIKSGGNIPGVRIGVNKNLNIN